MAYLGEQLYSKQHKGGVGPLHIHLNVYAQ